MRGSGWWRGWGRTEPVRLLLLWAALFLILPKDQTVLWRLGLLFFDIAESPTHLTPQMIHERQLLYWHAQLPRVYRRSFAEYRYVFLVCLVIPMIQKEDKINIHRAEFPSGRTTVKPQVKTLQANAPDMSQKFNKNIQIAASDAHKKQTSALLRSNRIR
jgi:hypothetical protein